MIVKKPKLVKTKDVDEDGEQIYEEISYCAICGKKADVDYYTILNKDYYDVGDSDDSFIHYWWTLFPDELEISISRDINGLTGITIYNGDYISDDEPMEIKLKQTDTIGDISKLFEVIEDDIEKYEKQVARGRGDQPTMHFCSKECAKKYILSILEIRGGKKNGKT